MDVWFEPLRQAGGLLRDRTPLPVYAPHQRAQDTTADHGLVHGIAGAPHADQGESRTPQMRHHDAKQHGTRNRTIEATSWVAEFVIA